MIMWIIGALSVILIMGYSILLILIFKFGSKKIPIEKNYDYEPTVSIVIPTMNEIRIIENRLKNILDLDYPRDKLEVLFIDNSNDGTKEVIKSYQDRYPHIKLQNQQRQGFNNALNQGYSSAEGAIVVKSDATAFPFPDSLRNIVANFSDERVGAVTGVHDFSTSGESIEKDFKGIMYKIQNVEAFFHSSLVSHGSFGGYRKELIPILGEGITADDSEVVVSAIRNGYRAIIDESVMSVEEAPEAGERRSQKIRRAAGVIKVILSNLDMMFNGKYGYFGMLTLPLDFFILILTPILSLTIFTLSSYYVITTKVGLFTWFYLAALVSVVGLIAFSMTFRAIFDTYLNSFLGLFKAFTKKKTWK